MADDKVTTLPLSAGPKIASYSLQPVGHSEIELAQAEHRICLVNSWAGAITPGSRILEIGCGQGPCTAVLAEAVGAFGTVDAVDPGSLDYGAPYTLGQAQAHLSAGPIGQRIRWHRAMPEDFLAQTADEGKTWEVAVLAHCIWYFKSASVLESILVALKGRVQRVCIAEYALHATQLAAVPHMLAALVRGTLECHKVESKENIQALQGPDSIRQVAEKVGWSVHHDSTVVPEQGLLDGYWETRTVIGAGFLREVEEHITDERVKVLLRAGRDSVLSSVNSLGGVKNVMTMDVWSAVLTSN